MIATPQALIRRAKFTLDAEQLFALMATRGALRGIVVIGLPVNMDGREGPSCQSARAFARNLLRQRNLPIAFWDERLSTEAVNRMLIDEADTTRARRAQLVDKTAAAWILQGALDRIAGALSAHWAHAGRRRAAVESALNTPVGLKTVFASTSARAHYSVSRDRAEGRGKRRCIGLPSTT